MFFNKVEKEVFEEVKEIFKEEVESSVVCEDEIDKNEIGGLGNS